ASEVADRIVAVCQDVVAQYAGGTIILVAHGFALRTGICWLLGGDYGASRCLGGLDNCSWSIVDHLPEDVVEARGFLSPWRLMAYNCGVPVPVDVDFAKGA
ncbi:histidine phosphatase family protein, partial [Cutibacterium sp.]